MSRGRINCNLHQLARGSKVFELSKFTQGTEEIALIAASLKLAMIREALLPFKPFRKY